MHQNILYQLLETLVTLLQQRCRRKTCSCGGDLSVDMSRAIEKIPHKGNVLYLYRASCAICQRDYRVDGMGRMVHTARAHVVRKKQQDIV